MEAIINALTQFFAQNQDNKNLIAILLIGVLVGGVWYIGEKMDRIEKAYRDSEKAQLVSSFEIRKAIQKECGDK